VVLLAVCFYTDAARRRIYNLVTLPAILVGFVLNLALGGVHGLTMSAIGAAIGFVGLFLLFMLGAMGGGDVKLMAAIGAIKAYPFVISSLLYSFLVGGFMGIAVLIWKQKFLRTMFGLFRWGAGKVLPVPAAPLNPDKMEKVPFGIAIVIGTICAEVMRMLGAPDIIQLWQGF
jgi:prepilin peptidase CpaA